MLQYSQYVSSLLTDDIVKFINDSVDKAARSEDPQSKATYIFMCKRRLDQFEKREQKGQKIDFPELRAPLARLEELEREVAALAKASAHASLENKAFRSLPLARQCEFLGIPLEVIELPKMLGSWMLEGLAYVEPEHAALAYFKSKGYAGLSGEGAILQTLMKCASFDTLEKRNVFKSRDDAYRRYFKAQCELLFEHTDEIIKEIRTASREKVAQNLTNFIACVENTDLYPAFDHAATMAIWDALGPDKIAEFSETFVQDPYTYAPGWPDLTLAHESKVRFIEVKTTDKLHESQRNTFTKLLIPGGAAVSVLQIKEHKNNEYKKKI